MSNRYNGQRGPLRKALRAKGDGNQWWDPTKWCLAYAERADALQYDLRPLQAGDLVKFRWPGSGPLNPGSGNEFYLPEGPCLVVWPAKARGFGCGVKVLLPCGRQTMRRHQDLLLCHDGSKTEWGRKNDR
mgnify:CR=1 FL=1